MNCPVTTLLPFKPFCYLKDLQNGTSMMLQVCILKPADFEISCTLPQNLTSTTTLVRIEFIKKVGEPSKFEQFEHICTIPSAGVSHSKIVVLAATPLQPDEGKTTINYEDGDIL